jgi:hypothetical protein
LSTFFFAPTFDHSPGHGLVEVTADYAAQDKKLLFDYAETLEKLLLENNIDLPGKSDRLQVIEQHFTHHADHQHSGVNTH